MKDIIELESDVPLPKMDGRRTPKKKQKKIYNPHLLELVSKMKVGQSLFIIGSFRIPMLAYNYARKLGFKTTQTSFKESGRWAYRVWRLA